MRKLFYFIFLLPLCAFGASNGSGEYDIVPRIINFLISVIILYYLVANPFKAFYKNRILRISSKLDEVQKKFLESKTKKPDTMKKLEEAKADAAAILVVVKKEAEVFAQKTKEETQSEFALPRKHFEEQKDYKFRKVEKEVVSLILREIFEGSNVALKQNEVTDIMMKKVP